MSRPRKVDYNEVISAWLRCGDATVVAATLKMGKSTVYKILNRYEYGLLGVDGGEPLALRELKPAAPVAWAEHAKVMADKLHALSMNGKTAASSDKGAVDFQYKGKPYHVIARFPVWPVVLAVAVVALGAWLWRAL